MVDKHVLVVEDEPDIATLLALIFRDNYDVAVAADLAEARAVLARGPAPDVIVLDVMLPDGDGLDWCREVKAAHPAVAVVVVSAYVRPGLGADAQGCGAEAFVEKPFDPDDLRGLVERLGRRRASA